MGAEAGLNFRDKARMKRVLSAHGLPCAQHLLAASAEEAEAFGRRVGYPLISKPRAGSGSRGTHRLDGDDQLAALLRMMPPGPENPVFLEEFIRGEEHSFDSVMLGGQLAWYSVNDYLPAPLEVVREPWIQWCVVTPRDVDAPEYRGIREVAGDALRALGLETGFSHMEWFRREDGSVAISEVGARPPGARFTNLISLAGGFDFFDAWARLVVFHQFAPRERPFAAGAAYLRGHGRGRVARVTGLEEVLVELDGLVVEARRPAAGQAASGTYEGEGYVIVRHPDTDVVREALRRIVGTVRV
jgi:biotin carboxylase